MKIENEHMAAVVAEASKRMAEPDYSATLVGEFVQDQMALTQYITAHENEIGGAEGVISVVFHAALLVRAIEKAIELPCPIAGFEDLDQAAKGDASKVLKKSQPAMHEFIMSNVENADHQRLLCLAGVAMTIAISEL
ncbi:MAG: hypothetical protein IPL79_19640 [Myxococcales bacterium]|nr:hypothetical protein [Myxococcales bacterium]